MPVLTKKVPDWVLYLVIAIMLGLGAVGLYGTLREPGACAKAGGTYFNAARGGVCVKDINGVPTRIYP